MIIWCTGALVKAQEENTHWDFPLSPEGEETETIVPYPDSREMTEGCQWLEGSCERVMGKSRWLRQRRTRMCTQRTHGGGQ